MTSSRRLLILFGCVALVAFLGVSPVTGDETDKKTKLKVLLPEDDAEVQVDGKTIPGEGKTRVFTPPALAKGKTAYKITGIWEPNNYTRFYRSRTVTPKKGETVEVDLRKFDPKFPDNIEIRYVPTPEDVVDQMCKLGKVTKDDVVYDLGCGDGRLVIRAVSKFKAKRGVGVDLDPERIDESKENAKKNKVTDKVEFRVGDVLKIKDLSNANVVLLYMGDDVNIRLRPILQKTLKPGSRIVSHRFTMGDWKPDQTIKFIAKDGDEYLLHLWTIKEKK